MSKTLEYLQNRMSDIIQEIENAQDMIAKYYSDEARIATLNMISSLQYELKQVKECISELE